MRQISLLVLGLVVAAIGAQGFILLVIGHDPGALRWLGCCSLAATTP